MLVAARRLERLGACDRGRRPVIRPVKGQLLELRARPANRAPAAALIRTPRCYIVNRGDGSS